MFSLLLMGNWGNVTSTVSVLMRHGKEILSKYGITDGKWFNAKLIQSISLGYTPLSILILYADAMSGRRENEGFEEALVGGFNRAP